MERKNSYLALIVSIVLISGTISPAFATTETLYMVSKGSGTSTPSQLWTLDKTTGIATPLASPVGFDACTSMDFKFGTLYAGCELGGSNRLTIINTLTGVGTDVGSNGGGANLPGMSLHPTTGTMYTYQTLGSGLGTLNLGTGLYTAIDSGFVRGGNGMAFASDGTLYIARADSSGADTINTVSLGNGDETFSATIGYVSPLADDDRTVAMDFSADGTLWTAIKQGGGLGGSGSLASSYLATINPTTGAMNTPVLIKDIGGTAIVGVDGIAFLIDVPVGGFDVSINTSALLLAGVQSVSMWMIPVILAGIGIGVFVIKKRN